MQHGTPEGRAGPRKLPVAVWPLDKAVAAELKVRRHRRGGSVILAQKAEVQEQGLAARRAGALDVHKELGAAA